MSQEGGNAGAAIMCWPVSNSQGLSDNENMWTKWGGEDVANDRVFWGNPVDGDDFDPFNKLPNATKALWYTYYKALREAKSICRNCPCNCSSVRISFIEIDGKGNRIDPTAEYHGVPAMNDVSIDCKRYKKKK